MDFWGSATTDRQRWFDGLTRRSAYRKIVMLPLS
jgi:hypothetical protein